MKTIQSCCLLVITLSLLSAQLNAQVIFATARELSLISRGVAQSARKGNPLYIPGKARVGNTGLYPFQVTHVLQRRATKAKRRALEMQKAHPRNKELGNDFLPVSRLRHSNPNLYPFLQTAPVCTPEQINLYLTAQENRLVAQEISRYLEIWPQLKKILPRLRQAADQTPTPADPIGFLAQTIPSEVNTIAIGEIHGFKDIRSFIARFLTSLRQERPDQEIFIFTEALEQGQEFFHVNGKYSVLPNGGRFGLEEVWQAARDNHIPIIGLEPMEVKQELQVKRYALFEHADPDVEYITPFFASLTGIKWRNKIFLKTLEQYRAQHPDALFVVHTGSSHVQYTAPFSLTAKLEVQKTFVLRISPTREQVHKKSPGEPLEEQRFMWDPLGDELNGLESFDQPFLYWQNPQLARIAGADVYIQAQESFIKPL